MKLIKLLTTLIIFLLIACGTESKAKLSDFDINPSGNIIVYTYVENDKSLIYRKLNDTDGQLLATGPGYSFYHPRFTADGNLLVFIGKNNKTSKSSIWSSDKEGNNVKKLYESQDIIVEAVSASDNKKVYFTIAGEYAAHSPLASKASHNFDVYEYNIENKQVRQVSFTSAYGLFNLTNFDEDKLLFRLNDQSSGLYFCSKNSKSELEQIITLNDTLRNSAAYAHPAYVDRENLICSSYYQLVKINLASKIEEKILDSNGHQFEAIRYSKGLNQIFFTQTDDSDNIYVIDMNGNKIKTISID